MQLNNPKIFLEGTKVYLRAFEKDDLDGDYRKWINDPEVTHYLQVGTFPQTDDDLRAYYERSSSSSTEVFFAIIEKESSKHIGNAQIYNINWIHRSALRGIMIGDKNCWGKGYALEVIQLLNTYTFFENNFLIVLASKNISPSINMVSRFNKFRTSQRE